VSGRDRLGQDEYGTGSTGRDRNQYGTGRDKQGALGGTNWERPSMELGALGCKQEVGGLTEYFELEHALHQAVARIHPPVLGCALDMFSQASLILQSRELDSIVCRMKFLELSYLEAFWHDYTSEALLEVLQSAFLTEWGHEALGGEDMQLFISVEFLLFSENHQYRPTLSSTDQY
uniref:TRADD-like N-terminal domain-containing protein n=1 Tax=Zonotrichia albicollis TaxID=44394 RepID=A0A8D2MY72_ZONAL